MNDRSFDQEEADIADVGTHTHTHSHTHTHTRLKAAPRPVGPMKVVAHVSWLLHADATAVFVSTRCRYGGMSSLHPCTHVQA